MKLWRGAGERMPAGARIVVHDKNALGRRFQVCCSGAAMRAINIIKTADILIPYANDSVNFGVLMWNVIHDVSRHERSHILRELSNSDIERLWRIAGTRYDASVAEISASQVPNFSIWDDLPTRSEVDECSNFRGRAVLPISLGLDKFSKHIFKSLENEQLYGRVVHNNVIGNRVYPGPLYFKVAVGSSLIPIYRNMYPNSGSMCDMVFSYSLGLSDLDILEPLSVENRWPKPRKENPKPFNMGFTDYIRVAGPGVYVGMGLQESNTRNMKSQFNTIPQPLFFLMIAT